MFNNTLTDKYIKLGIIQDDPVPPVLDGDGSDAFILDGDDYPQKEEKSRT